jgi:hypothetical protein
MKFQPGQSGNPAGRPLGARNKKTIATEAELAERAEKAVDRIIFLAAGGNAAAMRVCAEWARPGGNSRALALELPRVTCAADAQAALDTVIAEFGNGAITVREFPIMLGSVDRMARVAQRIDAMREREHERCKAQRVHGIHPDLMPKPTGETGRYEALLTTIERGEDPFPDDPVKSAYVMGGEDLYCPVNSETDVATDAEQAANAVCIEEAGSETLASSLPRAAGEGGSLSAARASRVGDFLLVGTHLKTRPSILLIICSKRPHPAPLTRRHPDALYLPVNSGTSGAEPPVLTPG